MESSSRLEKQTFSLGAKEILLKSVIQAIPTYALGCFRQPKNICHQITRMMLGFGGDPPLTTGKIHWQSWNKLYGPKEVGGLSFQDLEGFQSCPVGETSLELHHPDLLISKSLKVRYFSNSYMFFFFLDKFRVGFRAT